MCFYHDYEWTADVSETTEGPLPVRQKCDECRRWINAGETCLMVHQEQHEACLHCDPDDMGDYEGRGGGGECDHGEVFDYVCCWRCQQIRAAIRAVEEHEGCGGSEAEPSYGGMFEEVSDAGGWDEYVPKMLAIGQGRAVGLLPAPHPTDVWESLIDEFPESWDDGDEGQDRDTGGEG